MTESRGSSKKTIVCVEDEPHLRRDIIEELTAAGYEAIGAVDGREALAVLESVQPDLILCDISMPQLDGYGLLRIVRDERPDLAQVPLVFLTALDAKEEIVSGKRFGADDYLVKPVDYDLMLATIEARLREIGRIDEHVLQMGDMLSAAQSGGLAVTDGIQNVLDLLSFGVVLLSETEVIFANRCARGIHESCDGLSIDSSIHADSSQVTAAIRERWGASCKATRQKREQVASLSIPRRSEGRDFHLTICALPGSANSGTADLQAVAFITDPRHRPAMPAEVLADLFDLTPTEAEVARLLAQGLRTDEVAMELSIAATTVAFHLRNLFDKTGTNRQANLIALLLTGLASIGPDEATRKAV